MEFPITVLVIAQDEQRHKILANPQTIARTVFSTERISLDIRFRFEATYEASLPFLLDVHGVLADVSLPPFSTSEERSGATEATKAFAQACFRQGLPLVWGHTGDVLLSSQRLREWGWEHGLPMFWFHRYYLGAAYAWQLMLAGMLALSLRMERGEVRVSETQGYVSAIEDAQRAKKLAPASLKNWVLSISPGPNGEAPALAPQDEVAELLLSWQVVPPRI